jgi:hypothetical protein
VIAMSRATLIPITLGCVLLGLTYGLGLSLGWSNGAMGVAAVISCVATAVTRAMLAHGATRRATAGPKRP